MHDIFLDVLNDDLAPGSGVGNFLLGSFDTARVRVVGSDLGLARRSIGVLAKLFLPFLDLLVALLLVLIEILEKFPDGGDGIGA